MRRIGSFIVFALVATAVAAGRAEARSVTGKPIAPLPNAALQLTSYGGYVVFSQLDGSGKWQLMAWHKGTISPLDVPERGVPFDANAGPSASGAPTVVFSKCAHDPPLQGGWGKATGCHIYELALPDGTAMLVPGIYARRASDTTPAIWKGNIAFARITPGSSVQALYVWDRASGRLERVGGGPNICVFAARCDLQPGVVAWAREMSLDSNLLTYQWTLPEAEPGFGAAFAEIRVDPLHAARQDAPSRVVFYSILGGACNGEEAASPDAVGASVLYISHNTICVGEDESPSPAINSYSPATRRYSQARVSSGLAVAVAQDHGATYWIGLTATDPQTAPDEYADTCAPAVSTCTLMQTINLAGKLRLE